MCRLRQGHWRITLSWSKHLSMWKAITAMKTIESLTSIQVQTINWPSFLLQAQHQKSSLFWTSFSFSSGSRSLSHPGHLMFLEKSKSNQTSHTFRIMFYISISIQCAKNIFYIISCEQGTFKTGLCNTEKHVTYYIYCHNSDFYQDFETIFPRFTFKNAFRCLWFRIWNISKGNRLEQTKNTNISIHKEIHMQT